MKIGTNFSFRKRHPSPYLNKNIHLRTVPKIALYNIGISIRAIKFYVLDLISCCFNLSRWRAFLSHLEIKNLLAIEDINVAARLKIRGYFLKAVSSMS
jgi:hypothetical protein